MDAWLRSALDYVRDWLQFQVEMSRQPGCIIAIAHRGEIVMEAAFGHANLDSGEKLTPRHRFRIASHSKAFTAAGIMRLRERRQLKLDDPVGTYVKGLHPDVGAATLTQLLSHSAGLMRDGHDSGQFTDTRSYLSADELRAELALPPAIDPNTRFKYSNHGYGLLGLVIEAIASEPYADFIQREIIEAVGLRETVPDATLLAKSAPFARGHSAEMLLGRRVVIPGDNPTHAIAAAAGLVATAADTARFFAQLAPNARKSVLSVSSRREMIRRQWRIPQELEAYYGLALMSGIDRRLRLVRPRRRLPGLHLAHRGDPGARARGDRADQQSSMAGRPSGSTVSCSFCRRSSAMARPPAARATGMDAGGRCGARPTWCRWRGRSWSATRN